MKPGEQRFQQYFIEVNLLLSKASDEADPALFLYKNDLRTPLFMLEGLSKLYQHLHNKKLFKGVREDCKLPEDILGQVDFYDGFAKDFFADPCMPTTIRMAMEQRRDENLRCFHKLLKKKKWLPVPSKLTRQTERALGGADWLSAGEEQAAIAKYLGQYIISIYRFYESTGEEFTELENQVHKLRRMLRWISIYAKALQGGIQLGTASSNDPAVQVYLTPAVLSSPFNSLPAAPADVKAVQLQKDYFFALSYIISELGKLKDAGLRIIATAEGLRLTQFLSKKKAFQRAFELNGTNENGLREILDKAKQLVAPFFEKGLLAELVAPEQTVVAEKPAVEAAD